MKKSYDPTKLLSAIFDSAEHCLKLARSLEQVLANESEESSGALITDVWVDGIARTEWAIDDGELTMSLTSAKAASSPIKVPIGSDPQRTFLTAALEAQTAAKLWAHIAQVLTVAAMRNPA